MAAGAAATYLPEPVAEYVTSPRIRLQSAALEIARGLTDRAADPLDSREPAAIGILLALKRPGALCGDEPSKTALEQLHRAAEITIANLAPERRRALWIERKWLGCTPRSPEVRERLKVYAAIAARDKPAMLALARALLAGPERERDNWDRYLLAAAMLGALAAGEHEEARRLWESYGNKLYPGGDVPPQVVYLVNLS
jgi:hypothetical protein